MNRITTLFLLLFLSSATFLYANLPCNGSSCSGQQCKVCPVKPGPAPPGGGTGGGGTGGGAGDGSGGDGPEPEPVYSIGWVPPSPPAMITVRALSLKSTITFGTAPNEAGTHVACGM